MTVLSAVVESPMSGGIAGVLAAALSLLVGVAGWHYLFYSTAATRLEGVEGASTNRRRVILRRANGAAMVLLGMALVIGFWGVTWRPSPPFLVAWTTIFVLLGSVLVLVLLDLRMTRDMRLHRHGRGGGA